MFEQLHIPPFEDYTRNNESLSIDTQKIIIEVLGGIEEAQNECMNGEFISKRIVMGGKKAFLIRYKDRAGRYKPVSYMSYDEDENGNIHISEIQGTRERKVSYKFYSCFQVFDFFISLIKENFTKNGKRVTLDEVPNGLEMVADKSNAPERYKAFRENLEFLNQSITQEK